MSLSCPAFFIPYAYGIHTRASTKVHKVSFLFLVVGPILVNCLLMTDLRLSWIDFIIAFTAMYQCYEIGYMYNDFYTTQKEQEPTKWLDEKYQGFLADHFPLLVASRVVYIAACALVLKARAVQNLDLFLLMLVGMDLAYAFHNVYRDKRNVLTDAFLQVFKYFSVLVLFGDIRQFLRYALYIYLEIAMVRPIEYYIGKIDRFNISKARWIDTVNSNIDSCRLLYYALLTAAAALLTVWDAGYRPLLAGSAYLLLYRVGCKILAGSAAVAKEREKFGKSR